MKRTIILIGTTLLVISMAIALKWLGQKASGESKKIEKVSTKKNVPEPTDIGEQIESQRREYFLNSGIKFLGQFREVMTARSYSDAERKLTAEDGINAPYWLILWVNEAKKRGYPPFEFKKKETEEAKHTLANIDWQVENFLMYARRYEKLIKPFRYYKPDRNRIPISELQKIKKELKELPVKSSFRE